MLKTITPGIVVAALSAWTISSPASAQSFSPASSNITLSGYVVIQAGGQEVTCDLAVELVTDSSGQATITDRTVTPGYPLCGLNFDAAGAWSISAGPGEGEVALSLGVVGFEDRCSGAVVAGYANETGRLTTPLASLPGEPAACLVAVDLVSTPTMTVVP